MIDQSIAIFRNVIKPLYSFTRQWYSEEEEKTQRVWAMLIS